MLTEKVRLECASCGNVKFDFAHIRLNLSQIQILKERVCLNCGERTEIISNEAIALLDRIIFIQDNAITRHFYKLDVDHDSQS